jgi:hypothetical protein
MSDTVIPANPGFELLFLGPYALTYKSAPIIGWRFKSRDGKDSGPIPVVFKKWEREKGKQAIKYPNGRVHDRQGRILKDVAAWLAYHERRMESEVNEAMETGQGFTFKAKATA